jgi:hypothetical protein
MNKDFISYEQALALKELGFDEPCLAYYDKDGDFLSDIGINEDIDNLYRNSYFVMYKDFSESEYTAPLYQQAFRWFREKHNIQGYIYSSTVRGNVEKTKQFTGYIWNINGIDIPFLSTDARDELHDTYEEAELACLIKLIEIVKKK